MKISINMIEKYFYKHIRMKTIRADANLTIESFEVIDLTKCSFEKSNLYLMKAKEIPDAEEVPPDVNFLCYSLPADFELKKYQHINLLILEGLSEQKILNNVIAIFHQYNTLDEQLNSLIYQNFSLQKIIDLATEMVEMPLNVLDLNHNVLAISSHMDAQNDPIWESMKAGSDTSNYDMVLKGKPKMSDIIQAPGSSVEMISNISGHYIKVTMLSNKGHAVATFGMHKTNDFDKPFEKHTIQIYDYVAEKLNRNFNLFFESKTDRGLLYEEFLHDLFNRKLESQNEIEELSSKLGFNLDTRYIMGLISVRDSQMRTDYYFTMMESLERSIADSKCIAMDSFIYIIIPIADDVYLSNEGLNRLSEFMTIHNCLCLFSPVFISFEELYKINTMFKVVLTFIDNQGRHDRIYHFYEFASQYSMWLLAENMPNNMITHPMIQKIIDYDEQHHSDYLETLKCYFRNESSIVTTANLLHMHRNSLLYRINRIEKLLGVSLDDWKLKEQLLFFMICLENSDGLKK
ncbi:PucR family transcriptional regulator [Acetobacterium tundrae]|uniref:PucR C-terminal helix-turn-helix domain-containing protein n=1 Tax=Acetobacterium tundrae TaxID=132932 RepID=A0ABR6WM41_9FIRM|nr:helix-turn-helix domain-containing protein [Acetobacterium tundrae]MBC3797497.1 hypothetical protein [Acetobacterium tundrae]